MRVGPLSKNISDPLKSTSRVYAWTGSVQMDNGTGGTIERDNDAAQQVPGIGPARVRAFHARESDLFGERSRVFLGQASVGTAIHELVHARLAERPEDFPLWFEEGLAMLLGDGALFEGKWCVDGLACWPLRELSEEVLNDAQLELLLSLYASDPHDLRTNVLVHFLGWAIVFDLYRETGWFDWKGWSKRYAQGISVTETRVRMNRTLSVECVDSWLERLDDPDPAVRLCCAKGTWKLRSRKVADKLVRALRSEEDANVAASLAVNLLATAAEVQVGWPMRYRAVRVLRDPQVEDPVERKALRSLYNYFRYGSSQRESKRALEDLSRFLEE